MEKVEFKAKQLGLKSLSIPWMISCSNAGGDWRIIRAMIEAVFEKSELEVFICKIC